MGRCRDCRWWNSEDSRPDDVSRDMGTCWKMSDWPRSRALIVVENRRCETIWTASDFGCVHFEEKTAAARVNQDDS